MATLDDKLMGEKLHYYCSSSEDEDEPEPPPQGADGQPLQRPTPGKVEKILEDSLDSISSPSVKFQIMGGEF